MRGRASVASVAIIGEINLDFIILGAPRLPNLGEELIVDDMLLTLGSSSAIAACQLAKLGDEVVYISKLGDDEFGRRALEFLQERTVSTEHVTILPGRSSGLTVSISVGDERAMLTQLGTIQEMRWEDVNWDLVRRCQHLHISSYYLQRNLQPDIPRIFRQAKELGLTTSLDTGYPSDGEAAGHPAEAFPYLDVFLPNEVEATLLSGRPTPESALEALSGQIPVVAVKLGGDGAVARRGSETVRHSTFAVDVVDTTGAGDCFNGGFLHAHLAGDSLEGCLDLGLACGAMSIRAPGGATSQADLKEAREFIRTAQRRG